MHWRVMQGEYEDQAPFCICIWACSALVVQSCALSKAGHMTRCISVVCGLVVSKEVYLGFACGCGFGCKKRR